MRRCKKPIDIAIEDGSERRESEECQKFEGKHKLLPLPLIPISVEAPFQQWGLDFIGEIHPPSSG